MGEDPRVEAWIEQGQADIAAAGQTPEGIRSAYREHGPRAIAASRAMIAEWLAGL